MSLIDCHNHVGIEPLMYLRGYYPYGQQLQTLITEGRPLGISRWIVFPFITNFALDVAAMREGRIVFPGGPEQVPHAFENRRLMQEIYELFPHEGRRTIPFVVVDPMRATEEQAHELRKLRADFAFHGIKLQTTVLQAPIKHLLGAGRVFLDLAEEWDLPLLIHSSVLPEDTWAQASDILDVAETAPQLRFCLAHSLRYDVEQLNRLAGLPNCWFDCSAHRIHCQLAVEDNPSVAPPARRFASDYKRPEVVLRDLAEAYPHRLMWGSDSPAYSFIASFEGIRYELWSTYEAEVACLTALPTELQQRIAEVNTLEFLQLKEQ
jgi:predicted TIM-barrel fold metal-dependent hydrolase